MGGRASTQAGTAGSMSFTAMRTIPAGVDRRVSGEVGQRGRADGRHGGRGADRLHRRDQPAGRSVLPHHRAGRHRRPPHRRHRADASPQREADRPGGQLDQQHRGQTNLLALNATIEEVSAIAVTIAAMVEEQGAATAEIARNVQQTSASTQEMETTGQHRQREPGSERHRRRRGRGAGCRERPVAAGGAAHGGGGQLRQGDQGGLTTCSGATARPNLGCRASGARPGGRGAGPDGSPALNGPPMTRRRPSS